MTFFVSLWVMAMVFNVTFNNNLAISWWSVLLEEETREPGENPRTRRKPPSCRKSQTNFIT